jgi:hypothetical protein
MRPCCALLACLLWVGGTTAQDAPIDADVQALLTTRLAFSADELRDLRRGQVVKHGLATSAPGEVAVAGAVRIRAPKSAFFARVRDIARFKNGPGVLQIGRFSSPPVLDDLAALTVDQDDFDPRSCRAGDCGIRLPASIIERIGREVDTRAPDAQARGAALFKRILLDEVSAYTSGVDRMTQYDDGSTPIRPGDALHGILAAMPEIGALMPGLPDHLSRYPSARVSEAEDFVYWSKEKFGFAPFITVTHVTIVCPSPAICLMTTRDVYSSRYLDASVALAIAADAGSPDAFDLIYDNRSRASALNGGFASLRKMLTERRARGALEDNLKRIRKLLEKG